MKNLEDQVDKLFDENPILTLPFPYIYNHFCQVAMRQILDEKEIPYSTVIPYAFIFNKVKNFSNQTLGSCTEVCYQIQREDFKNLFACANLNIVFPFLHSGIYNFNRTSDTECHIDYRDKKTEEHELSDAIVTQLSLPAIPALKRSPRTLFDRILKRLKKEESVNPINFYEYISTMYSCPENAFIEADIIPDEFYIHIGFSSGHEFKKIRNAFVCIGQTYIDTSFVVDKYIEVNELYNTPLGDRLWEGMAMAKLKHADLQALIQKLTNATDADYEKFTEFFFCGEGQNTNLHNKFVPPFWRIEDDVFFFPAIVPTLLGARNLLISIQNDKAKSKNYKYDSMISKLFEPELLKRASIQFEKNGYSISLEKNFNGGEIDLLVYCEKSRSILTIQAKATLYAESARMAKRLDDRVSEGVDQTLRFDNLCQESQLELFKKAFPKVENMEDVKHIRAILTNSGFGTTNSWQLLESHDITPLNCNLLKNVLSECESLLDLPEKTKLHIKNIKDNAEIIETMKVFDLPGHTVRQRHVDIQHMKKLYEAQYWGE